LETHELAGPAAFRSPAFSAPIIREMGRV